MIRTAFRDGMNSLQNFSSDDILSALGLEKRRDPIIGVMLPSVALFAAGALVGAAAAVLLTPKTGPALRRELTEGARDLSQKLGSTATQATQAVQEFVGGSTRNSSSHASSPT
jgi:YtxH-like protein